MRKQISNKFFAIFLTILLIVSSFPQVSLANDETSTDKTFDDVVSQGSYNPHEDYKYLDVRFWEDEAPEVGFYINHGNLYNLTTVSEPGFGTSNGEWTVMDLLRGLHGGYYYNGELSTTYFDNYLEQVEKYVTDRDGNLDRNKSTEWSRSFLALTPLGYDVTNVAGYDFIDKLSESYTFSYRQGINGPIWAIIALNTGPYELYEDKDNDDVNTIGKMIDYILDREIEQTNGTLGGWTLWGNVPDTDITGMALQALAPYYNDKKKFEETSSTYSYADLSEAVERGVYMLSEMQLDNGGFPAFGNVNVESTVQAVVALTALDMDPVSSVKLPSIGKTANFVTEGAVHDNVKTNNMVDKLLTFWAPGTTKINDENLSEIEKEIYRISGGFKHVTSGDDGGGHAGTSVNGMATDQAIYGLISYDRYKNGETALYDMSDMIDGQYKDMLKASKQTVTFESEDATESEQGKRYGLVELPEGTDTDGKTFKEWNSEEDGSGITFEPKEMLVVPEKDITLHAQYENEVYSIDYELNGGSFNSDDIVKEYTIDDEIILPTGEDINKEGYTFVGWFEDKDFSGSKLESITVGSMKDIKVYAKWEEAVNEDEVAGKEVNEMIESLPTIENVTLDHQGQIETARTAYEELSSDAKEYVNNFSKLEALEQKIEQLKEEYELKEKQEALNNEINNVLDLEIRKLTNESAQGLGKSVGKAENLLKQSELQTQAPVLLSMTSTTADQELLQKLSNSLEEIKAELNNVQYKSDEDDEVVVSHLYFEKHRVSEYDLETVSLETKEEIEEKISLANELLENEDVSQEEIDSAVESLQEDVKKFKEEQLVDKTILEEMIEVAENEDLTNKTEESIQALQDAINAGKEILAKSNTNQDEVNKAIDAIDNAIYELEELVNKDGLQEEYDIASKLDVSNKTETSKNNLENATAYAKSILAKEDVTQEEVDEALQSLQRAMDNLEEKEVSVNKDSLQKILDDVKELDTSNKTEASVKKLNKALEKAEKVLDNNEASQKEVDEASEDLQKAIEQLQDNQKPKPKPEPGSKEPVKPKNDTQSKVKKDSDTSKQKETDVSIEKTDDKNKVENQGNEDKLPKTATTMYNALLIGFVLLLIGSILFVSRRKLRNK